MVTAVLVFLETAASRSFGSGFFDTFDGGFDAGEAFWAAFLAFES